MADTNDFGVTGGLVPPQLLARFEERIASDLADKPPTLDSQRLRRDVADLLPRAGMVSHYELLGVSVGATVAQVTAAFIDLGRRVHPSLAPWLQLPEAVLRLVFEHATQAYLVLSDPVRRKQYDRDNPSGPETETRSAEELAEVRRDMARKCFRRAQTLLKVEQYHYVVELMRDAVVWDPRPEAYALLAEAQGKNPNWRPEALANLQHAIKLAPSELVYRLKLGKLLEEMERVNEAIEEYRAVLEKAPNQPDAVEGLERLGGNPPTAERKGWRL